MIEKKKYLLLYLKTGGGHLAPARSICKALEQNYGAEVEPVLVDGFEKTRKLIKISIEGGYRNLQAKARWFYETLYAVNKIPVSARILSKTISFFVKRYLKEVFKKSNPDKIIIFHFFLIEPVYQVLKELDLSVPVITVVTDPYTAHPLWFLRKEQNFIVFSERLKKSIIRKEFEEKNINVFPFILNDKFSVPIPAAKIAGLKSEMGFDANKKIILLLGGGDGIPKGFRILKILLENLNGVEIAIVCGKNKSLQKKAQLLNRHEGKGTVKIYGYVNFVYELLNISDLVITKCGASTFMEILMSRKIPIITNYMWEQEKGNVEYLVENNLGIYEPKIKRLPQLIKSLLEDDRRYRSFIKNIENESLENGSEKVASFIKNFEG